MTDSIMIEQSPMTDGGRKVSFASEVRTLFVESRVHFSKQEIQQSWYSQEEMRAIQLRRYQDAARLESSAAENDLQANRLPCRRGLEALTRKGIASMGVAVRRCVDAVMDEQDIQWKTGYDDYDRFAMVSQQVTKRSIQEAIERAIQDAKAARKIYRMYLQEKRNCPPMMPKRRESRDNLRKIEQQGKVSSSLVHQNLNFCLLEGPALSALLIEGRKRIWNDDSIMHVDLATCKRFRNDLVPTVGYPMISTFKTKVA